MTFRVLLPFIFIDRSYWKFSLQIRLFGSLAWAYQKFAFIQCFLQRLTFFMYFGKMLFFSEQFQGKLRFWYACTQAFTYTCVNPWMYVSWYIHIVHNLLCRHSCATPNNEADADAFGNSSPDLTSAACVFKYKIHYPGWDARWDEWVRRERLRWAQKHNPAEKICVNDYVEVHACCWSCWLNYHTLTYLIPIAKHIPRLMCWVTSIA